jgi:hypothetical protein
MLTPNLKSIQKKAGYFSPLVSDRFFALVLSAQKAKQTG